MNTGTTPPPPPGVGIVDDDRELRTALRLLLESAGHVVETWADADACLAAMHPQRSGCLLLSNSAATSPPEQVALAAPEGFALGLGSEALNRGIARSMRLPMRVDLPASVSQA